MIKKLTILGLLLIPSFSFAVNNINDLGQYEDLGGNLCTINSDLSFNCEHSNNIIVGTDSAWYKTSSSYFWTNNGLAYYIYSNFTIYDNGQGYISSFEVCGGNVNCNNPSSISYSDFIDYYNNNTLTAWEWYSSASTPGWAGPVFIFGDTYIYFSPVTSSGPTIILWKGGVSPYSFGLVGWGLDANYSNIGVINTPVKPKLPDYTIEPGQCVRKGDAMLGFEYLGLSKQLCYGGFDLSDLYVESEKFSDWVGYNYGGGVSIFDLHSAYSGGLTMKPFLSSYYQSYLNGQVSNFYNKSKGLFMLFQQYYSTSNLDSSSFKLNDLIDYCDLYFDLYNNNYENDMDCYTGGNKNSIDSYNFSRIGRDSNDGGFSFTGVLGGNGTGFSTPEEFFGRLSNLFQTNIRGIDSTFPSMIPSYIVFFMLAIIFIRIISH